MLKSLDDLEFIFPWRSYQAELLKQFNSHIADNHFHVIAPPGSGKTILGLEIVRKLGKKTLVLAPTLTIRNQWEDRLQNFFTENCDFEAFSFDIKSPSDVTFSTYQSLHAFYKTFEDKNDYYQFFNKHNIETLVLDEAHHLKNAWWNCLMDLKRNSEFYIVALTATPPYDSSRAEVSKYFTLCGEVDDEIAVPDLVREGDLSPHQDFVYFSKPEDLEINFIVDFRRDISDFKDELVKDDTFIDFLIEHRFYKNPNWHLDELYSNTDYFSAILIFLYACGFEIDHQKLEVLGFEKQEMIQFPELDLYWLGILFQNILVSDREHLIEQEKYIATLEKRLRRLNVFERKSVDFIGKKLLYKSLSNSPSKLKSIVSIVKAERESLKSDLRCVVLTDYIRKEFLNTTDENIADINKIGVLPIFQYVRYYCSRPEVLAVLSGSVVIVHQSILKAFETIESLDNFSFSPLQTDASFLLVNPKGKPENSIVSIITQLFEAGHINVLIGTKSLLGEGWDAPSINSLVLASFIGSFVSSNQMRGRAIRKDANAPNKTGNIWHLACVDPTNLDGGREVDTLKRRFEAFVGVTNSTIPFIANGFERLNIPDEIPVESIEALNEATIKHATNRILITEKWNNAIGKGTKLTKEVKVLHQGKRPFKKQKQICYFDALRFFVVELFFTMMLFYVEFIVHSFNLILQRGVYYFIYAFLAAAVGTFGYKFYKAVKLYLRHGYLYKKIGKMGLAILDTLDELGYVTSNRKHISVTSHLLGKGDVVCNLVGANALENSLFAKALSELIEPVESPRYLIIKTNIFRKRFDVENFYPVPEMFGDKKENALIFQNYWTNYLGKSKLFFTRSVEGRKLLLKARLYHVYNAFKEVTKEVVVWK
ncbi:DEAD/DEAH box helicase family protein [Winogradskyella sp. F6397]|uniref:DEAD/DEAH box helicase family protein n=1 Tax=Winogradskyella marina TaxID=2785530 RepID=A0ABS0EEQ3_9FLAO|nr:DEAD/DEAH box helicase family protein [Winogradskyella marina]MBF8148940.1 DEAD/DEAH box helicase family protein [Winogradskyella marina]